MEQLLCKHRCTINYIAHIGFVFSPNCWMGIGQQFYHGSLKQYHLVRVGTIVAFTQPVFHLPILGSMHPKIYNWFQ
jgi:hypothetical protein